MKSKTSSPPTPPDRRSVLDQVIAELRVLFEQDSKARESLSGIIHLELRPKFRGHYEIFSEQMSHLHTYIEDVLQNLLMAPPHHSRHYGKLETFHRVADYDKSVFIMTKFPAARTEANTDSDIALRKVIDAVSKSIVDCGFYPRLASDKKHHTLLWDNVELYLLGCGRGVAIVEDRYMPELNPNIAMEWGWMRGMGKDVLFLVENDFEHFRADWSGLLQQTFSWDQPDEGIEHAIKDWLQSKEPE